VRLHSAIGYIAPKDKLEGRDGAIFKERDQKLEAAREARKQKRREMRLSHDAKQITSTAVTINQLTQQARFSTSC
jgi:putative transposase